MIEWDTQKNTEAGEKEDRSTGETKKGKKLKTNKERIKKEKKEDDPDYRYRDFRDEIMDVEKMRNKIK
jgi:hypothetical protein